MLEFKTHFIKYLRLVKFYMNSPYINLGKVVRRGH